MQNVTAENIDKFRLQRFVVKSTPHLLNIMQG